MARLASSHKADVRFGTAAPGELGYIVLYQSPAQCGGLDVAAHREFKGRCSC